MPRRSLVLAGLVLACIAPTAAPQSPLSPELIRSTVESLADLVHKEYMDADVAARVHDLLRRSSEEGRYASETAPEALAASLTKDLVAATSDRHLVVAVVPQQPAAPASPQRRDSRADAVRRTNGGIQRLEVLPGNVGYLNVTAFWRPEEAADAIATAMRALRNADALIVDMRANSGGSPETVALLASYFFDMPALPLFDIVHRQGPPTRYATAEPALAERDQRRPVYVLTSPRSFSAGEGFAFLLQERRRAEVVGTVTAGAANPGQPYRINDRFEVTIPNGLVRTAIRGRNWEGSGVKPDVAASDADALRVAHARALRRLIDATRPGDWRDVLQQELRRTDAQNPAR